MHPSFRSIINVFHNKIYRPFPTTAINTNKNELDPHFTFSGTKGGNFHLKVYRKYTNIETVEKVEKKSQLCEGCRIVKSETASDYI
jgi:hypothetical protein